MSEATIDIIEDDDDLRTVLEKKLTNQGFEVKTAADGQTGLAAVQENKLDLVILDLGLPDIDGFVLCRRLRELSDVPILILTAKTEEAEQVMGLELGADDYVTKPFSPRVLTSRIRALLRRRQAPDVSKMPLLVGVIAPDAVDDEIWVAELAAGEGTSGEDQKSGAGLALSGPGDLWRIDQRWHLVREAKPPANEAQLKRSSMGIVDAGYIVEIISNADWIGVVKEVYLYKATTMDEMDQPIAHGYLIGNTIKSAELVQEGQRQV